MEVISTPSLDASPDPWLLHLALHETRHVVQLDKIFGNKYRVGNLLFGEQAIGFKLLLTPLWFLEGDAVFAETAYSKAGRGRQSAFYIHYLAHMAQNGGSKYSYDKWLLGSYKDYIPNHYSFGYQMVGYTNMKYGTNVWSNALTDVSRKLFFTFPFYRSVKRSTKQSTKQLFAEIILYHDSLWQTIKVNDEINIHKQLLYKSYKHNNFIEYTHPYLINDSTLISLKKSLSQRPQFIIARLNDKSEKRIHTPGILTGPVNYSTNQILWSQYSAHPRWEYVDYSEIWQYDLTLQKAQRITTKTRCFNPIEYANGSIAVIENSARGDYFIAVIDQQGKKLHSLKMPNTLELKEICRGDNTEIFARCASPNGMVILKYPDMYSQPDTTLGPIHNDISNLTYNQDYLYFTKTHNYRENIYAINTLSNKVYSISNSTFGLSNLSYNKQLVASEFSTSGAYPVVVSIDSTFIGTLEKEELPLFFSKNTYLDYNLPHNAPDHNNHNSEYGKYVKAKNIFNIHSWAPIYYNPMDLINGSTTIYPGVSFISQNLTSTVVSSIGYSYNKTHGGHAHVEYMRWYPKIMAGIDYGNEYSVIQHGPLAPNFLSYSDQPRAKAQLRVRIPYTFSSGNIVSSANLGISLVYSNDWMWSYADELYQKWYGSLEPYISFYALTRKAHRDIRSKYGVQLFAATLSSPTSKVLGNSSFIKGWLFLPGLSANHSLLLTGQSETQTPQQYVRTLRYTPARGYDRSLSKSVVTASIDYTFPAAYLDIAIGPVLYIKRLVGNFFYDNAVENRYIQSDNGLMPQRERIQTVGLDITTDFHLFRTSYPLNVGYRGGFRLNEGTFFHSIIFSASLESLTGYLPSLHNAVFNF
jgi:hypothetical protein